MKSYGFVAAGGRYGSFYTEEALVCMQQNDILICFQLDEAYRSTTFMLPLNNIDLYLLVSDIQLSLPNASILS